MLILRKATAMRAREHQSAAAAQDGTQRAQMEHQENALEPNGDMHKPQGSIEDNNGQAPNPASNGTAGNTQRMPPQFNQRGLEGSSGLPVRQAWEYIDEVGQILKTAFPLLIMSLETIVEQITLRFKAQPEEEVYRLICILIAEAESVGFNSCAMSAPY